MQGSCCCQHVQHMAFAQLMVGVQVSPAGGSMCDERGMWHQAHLNRHLYEIKVYCQGLA